MADEKKPYRVKPGYRHGMNNEYGPGDIVELTDHEAAPLYFKLEAIRGEPAAMAALRQAQDTTQVGASEEPARQSWPEASGETDLERLLGEDLAAKLAAAGIDTLAEVRAASDKELEQIPGVGRATLKTIREATK